MRDEWASAFTDKARAYWTRERLDDLVRGKDLNVLPHEAPSLLRALGILHRDGSMPPAQRRKFFQCNHMVAALGPSLRELVASRADEPIRLVDAACGRSYLTLLLAHTLTHRYRVPVQVLAVDRNAELVDESARRTTMAGLDSVVKHFASPLATLNARETFASSFGGAAPTRIDAVVSLHACNTATDDAIELGVRQRHAPGAHALLPRRARRAVERARPHVDRSVRAHPSHAALATRERVDRDRHHALALASLDGLRELGARARPH